MTSGNPQAPKPASPESHRDLRPVRTFSFVDRITDLQPGRSARGCFTVPAELTEPSPCLVAEAIGQLAGWVAMAQHDFRLRPVAALAGALRVMGAAKAGRTLDLAVGIERCDADTVVYGGWARLGDTPVVELSRCMGAMLPLRDFDAPEAAREQFEMLRGPGAGRASPLVIAPPEVVVIEREPGRRVRATLQIPAAAPFFADHFPRKPVFPATLLVDAQISLALALARDVLQPGSDVALKPHRVADVKLRAFISPGQLVDIAAETKTVGAEAAGFLLTAWVEGRAVARARIDVGPSRPVVSEQTVDARP